MTRTSSILIMALALLPVLVQGQILIGQTAGFSGPVAAGVKETTDGAKLYFDHVNASGGVHGQKIELISLDDKFDPKLAGENAKTLIEQKNVFAMFLTRGTPHTEAVIPTLDLHGVPLIGPSTGAVVLHEPVQKHIFNVRATYQREVEKAVLHLHTVGVTRIAMVYADDSFGADAMEGARRRFTALGFQPVATLKSHRTKPDYATIIPAITSKEAQAVIWIGTGQAVADGVRALRAVKSAARVVTLSNNASSGFVKSLGDVAAGVIVTQVYPSERTVAYSLVSEASALARAKNSTISPASLEGFTAAKVLVEGLRRAGPKPTRAKFMTALESMRKLDLGGLEISYSATDHSGLDFADLSIIDHEGKFKR
jgi:branched-chain amino acid transport system substrate-binding protein